MMDELELLKKDWQKKDIDLPKLSYEDIHKLIWKKSSSIVKWILIISILEFLLPQVLYLVPNIEDGMSMYKKMGIASYLNGVSVFYYIIVLYFIFQFYSRFKEISALDNSKNLMRKIIKTRKTVKHYVIFSLSTILVYVLIILLGFYITDDVKSLFSDLNIDHTDIPQEKLRITLMLTVGIFGVLFTIFMAGIYFLLYGLLLKKLNNNYNELKQLEF